MTDKWYVDVVQGSKVLAVVDEQDNAICDVWSYDSNQETLLKNATLISKAPEMFAILKNLHDYFLLSEDEPVNITQCLKKLIDEVEYNENIR